MGDPQADRAAAPAPPPEEAPKCGPGPFSLADPDTVRGVLVSAGWREPALEAIDGPVRASDTVDDAIAFQLAIGPAGEMVREAGPLGEEKRPLILADLGWRWPPTRPPTASSCPPARGGVTARA